MRNVKLNIGVKVYEALTIKEIFIKMVSDNNLPKEALNDLDDLRTITNYISKRFNKCIISA